VALPPAIPTVNALAGKEKTAFIAYNESVKKLASHIGGYLTQISSVHSYRTAVKAIVQHEYTRVSLFTQILDQRKRNVRDVAVHEHKGQGKITLPEWKTAEQKVHSDPSRNLASQVEDLFPELFDGDSPNEVSVSHHLREHMRRTIYGFLPKEASSVLQDPE
jgi:hypothetical protein